MHRFLAFGEITVLQDLTEGAHNLRLDLKVHSQIGVVPITQHPQTDKTCFLNRHLFFRVLSTQCTETRSGDVLAMELFYHQFDGQTMAVPARHIWGVKPSESLGADNYVFQYLVNSVPKMNVIVSIRRAIVQHELGTALG